jgi:hypothetical protein
MFLEIPPSVLWPYVAGAVLTLITLFATRQQLSQAAGWDKILAVGGLFFAAPLAAFGAEHLTIAPFIAPMVPSWIPWHLFWAYFVGTALVAAALSIATRLQVRLSCTLLGSMFFFFVLSLHIPRVIANPKDRIAWAVAIRDLSFAGGAWALAGAQTAAWRTRGTSMLITVGRVVIATAAIFYAVEHFLHPAALPGVPLEKLTPAWIPGRILVGYVTGGILGVAGICLLTSTKARMAATYLGTWIVLLVLLVYLPMVIAIPSTADGGVKIEGLNYFFDTMLFAGAILALANALPKDSQ